MRECAGIGLPEGIPFALAFDLTSVLGLTGVLALGLTGVLALGLTGVLAFGLTGALAFVLTGVLTLGFGAPVFNLCYSQATRVLPSLM